MYAFAITDWDMSPQVTKVPVPEVGPGEVRVRVQASSVNGFEVAVAAGMMRGITGEELPVIMGKDFAGVVEAVGEGVTEYAVGNQVFGVVNHPSAFHSGAFAERLVVPVDAGIARLPKGINIARAGALGLAGTTALQAVEAVAPRKGQTVLISGATGGVGTFAVLLAVATGATVIATSRAGRDADFVERFGAKHTVDHTGDLVGQVREIAPKGVDAVIHLAGETEELASVLAPGGRFASTVGANLEQFEGQDIQVFPILAEVTPERLKRLAAKVAAEKLTVQVQQTFGLKEVNSALASLADGSRGKIAISIP